MFVHVSLLPCLNDGYPSVIRGLRPVNWTACCMRGEGKWTITDRKGSILYLETWKGGGGGVGYRHLQTQVLILKRVGGRDIF